MSLSSMFNTVNWESWKEVHDVSWHDSRWRDNLSLSTGQIFQVIGAAALTWKVMIEVLCVRSSEALMCGF